MPYAHLVKPGEKVKLAAINAGEHDGLTEAEAQVKIKDLGERMGNLLEWLFAAKQNSLLIVLQGRDTSGKDGAIRRFLQFANVQSTRVCPFKVPSEQELGHDFLWRIHAQAPAKGDVTLFNRSHYEDVIAVRVHDLLPKKVWKKRYKNINAFEELLTESSTILVKFYLHISREEQKERLLAREENVEKAWKLSVGDWKERELWSATTEAYEDLLEQCSTKRAPWRVIPANHKWFRDLAILQAVVSTLEPYEKQWKESLEQRGKSELKELAAYRKSSPPD